MAGGNALDPIDVIIGNMALQQGLIAEDQLSEARMMSGMGDGRSLAQILYQLGYLSIQQAEKLEHAAKVLRVREEDKLLCELAVKRKMITQAQADEVLQVQKNASRNPGDIPRAKELLINRNYMTEMMLDILLSLVKQVNPLEKGAKEDAKPAAPHGTPVMEKKPKETEGAVPGEGDSAKKVDTRRFTRGDSMMPPTQGKSADAPGGSKPEAKAPEGEMKQFLKAVDILKAQRKGGDAPKKTETTAPTPGGPKPGRPDSPSEREIPALPPPKSPDSPGYRAGEGGAEKPSVKGMPATPLATGGVVPAGDRVAHGRMFTEAVHAGHTMEGLTPTTDPIHPSATFDFASMEALEQFLNGKPGFWYSRHGNPTVAACEQKIAAIEGTEDAVLCSSGLGALFTTIFALLRPGDTITTHDGLYGGTWHIFTEVLPDYSITTRRLSPREWMMMREHFSGTTKMVYFEPLTNPMLRLWDPRPAVRDAKHFGILTMVDNTFATAANMRPVDMGVDIILHSATKYLGGHSDLTAGVVCARRDICTRIRERLKLMGACLSAFDAWLLMRGLKTFPLRMRAHNENAFFIARELEKTGGKVKKVHYPGLESHPDHAQIKELFKGYGGMVTFEVEGGFKEAKAFANRLKLCHRAVSLGGVETLVSLPILSSHHGLPERDLEKAGITPGCVRLSVGIEDPDDILADLKQALG
jgi:methionine-gamma-lyase